MEVKSFFDIVSIILEKKPIPSNEVIQKHCNTFMISQMLSCDIQFTGIAHEMAKLKISNKMYFDCLYYGIPKCKKYIKWNATKAKKEQNIQYLMDYFGCSQLTAKAYEQLIDAKELNDIREFFENRGKA
jgi:hypothetical protein